MECIRLRVKACPEQSRRNLDFAQHQIIVRETKGDHDRVTMLPDSLVALLKQHLFDVRQLHNEDLEQGLGAVYLPDALERKYPNANREWREAGSTYSPLTASPPIRARA